MIVNSNVCWVVWFRASRSEVKIDINTFIIRIERWTTSIDVWTETFLLNRILSYYCFTLIWKRRKKNFYTYQRQTRIEIFFSYVISFVVLFFPQSTWRENPTSHNMIRFNFSTFRSTEIIKRLAMKRKENKTKQENSEDIEFA